MLDQIIQGTVIAKLPGPRQAHDEKVAALFDQGECLLGGNSASAKTITILAQAGRRKRQSIVRNKALGERYPAASLRRTISKSMGRR